MTEPPAEIPQQRANDLARSAGWERGHASPHHFRQPPLEPHAKSTQAAFGFRILNCPGDQVVEFLAGLNHPEAHFIGAGFSKDLIHGALCSKVTEGAEEIINRAG